MLITKSKSRYRGLEFLSSAIVIDSVRTPQCFISHDVCLVEKYLDPILLVLCTLIGLPRSSLPFTNCSWYFIMSVHIHPRIFLKYFTRVDGPMAGVFVK